MQNDNYLLPLIGGAFLILWGGYGLYIAFTNKTKRAFWLMPDILPKGVLGDSYNPVVNFIFGVITFAAGVILLQEIFN